MDVLKVAVGSPALLSRGWITLKDAALASGFTASHLLSEAMEGRLALNALLVSTWGHWISGDDISVAELSAGRLESDDAVPAMADHVCLSMRLSPLQPRDVAALLLKKGECSARMFVRNAERDWVFVPEEPVVLRVQDIWVSAEAIETLRKGAAASMTAEQLCAARERAEHARLASKPVSDEQSLAACIEGFLGDAARRGAAADHVRRIRKACRLFAESSAIDALSEVSRDAVRAFATHLATLPARANLAVSKHGDSIPEEWPRLSDGEQKFLFDQVCRMLAWSVEEGHLDTDPSAGLSATLYPGKTKKRQQDARQAYSDADLVVIFEAPWFRSGVGVKTRNGTYREFMPHYYWLPLLGLFTGARINELCQLRTEDIKRTAIGTNYLSISEDGERLRLKSVSSRRDVPLHPKLIELGFLKWVDALRQAGFTRLFPELAFNEAKGYGKAASKWFSRYLEEKGWKRDGQRTFHSFRHTLITHCSNTLRLQELTVRQIAGHQRGSSETMNVYRKDESPDELFPKLSLVSFALPIIEPFNVQEGLQALHDALRRKESFRKLSGQV